MVSESFAKLPVTGTFGGVPFVGAASASAILGLLGARRGALVVAFGILP
jgi:hypothetical protein